MRGEEGEEKKKGVKEKKALKRIMRKVFFFNFSMDYEGAYLILSIL